MGPDEFKDRLDDGKIVAAIKAAEAGTSGEIRVFVTRHCPGDPLAEARRQFELLGMSRTPLRNAVLLFFAPAVQRFAIVGDEGIHFRCGQAFWDRVAQSMESLLKAGDFTGAVVAGVAESGREMARHFPKTPLDRNDLPDAVIRD